MADERLWTFWAIKDRRAILRGTVRDTRREAIAAFAVDWREPWESLRKRGYRAVRLQATESGEGA